MGSMSRISANRATSCRPDMPGPLSLSVLLLTPIVYKYFRAIGNFGASATIGPIFQISQSGMNGRGSAWCRPCTGGRIGYFHFGNNHASLFRDTRKSGLTSKKNAPHIWLLRRFRECPLVITHLLASNACTGLLGCFSRVSWVFGGSLSRFRALVWVHRQRCESCRPWEGLASLSPLAGGPCGRFRIAGRGAMLGTVAQAHCRIVSCPAGSPLPLAPCALMPAKRKAIRLPPCAPGHLPRE